MAEVFCSGGAMRGGVPQHICAWRVYPDGGLSRLRLPAEHRAAIPADARNELE
ncbi:hypothetical protein [Mycolicibacterium sp. YH-1]|uniref:hypothetical protein n=1 Tax=Mycolicibacterium sp. YH-1 TaxID=2908837 RepID=UPI001F4C00A4|nr:hypothetical protein [Mycolicibacterium sp. YH-1]UNB54340.1 hypothetical protein L0M16_08460 [Mycolicibacterium sp. YH-1]